MAIQFEKGEGKFAATVVCWLLGIGCLFSWNSMVSIIDLLRYLVPEIPSGEGSSHSLSTFSSWSIANSILQRSEDKHKKKELVWLFPFLHELFNDSCCNWTWAHPGKEGLERTLVYV